MLARKLAIKERNRAPRCTDTTLLAGDEGGRDGGICDEEGERGSPEGADLARLAAVARLPFPLP